MDPHSGRMYESVEAAHADGVADPVEVSGSTAALQALSENLRRRFARPLPTEEPEPPRRRMLTAAERTTRAKRRHMATRSRKINRGR